jgi:3-oxoacyl-[acyl-carrier protein] reductase
MPRHQTHVESYLVVGASGTIGAAVARALAAPGVTIGLHYCKNLNAVQSVQRSLEEIGATAVCLQSELDSEDACTKLADQFSSAKGVPTGIALCGGRVPWKAWQDLSATDWQDAFFEHCIAPIAVTKALLPAMQQRGSGRIVFLSSIAAKYAGSPLTLHYAAAKSALETTMRGLSRNVAGQGVRVNCVRAGFVDTPQQHAGRTQEEIVARIARIPVGRAGTPEEIAAAFVYLLSAKADFVTGEIITVAGGD